MIDPTSARVVLFDAGRVDFVVVLGRVGGAGAADARGSFLAIVETVLRIYRDAGTAGGDPAAGTGDGALSTPAAMVAAAADLPVRSLRANSSATLSCPPSGRAPAY